MDDEPKLAAMLAELEKAPLVCVDTETDALGAMSAGLVGLAFAIKAAATAGMCLWPTTTWSALRAALPLQETLARLKKLLEDPRKPKVGQHIKYDLNVLARHDVEVQGVAYDTMCWKATCWTPPATATSMDTLAEKYLHHRTIHFEDVAGKGKAQISFNQVPVASAAEYSAEDVDITLRLHQALYPKVCEVPALKKVFETIEMPLLPVLARIERDGVKIDAPLLALFPPPPPGPAHGRVAGPGLEGSRRRVQPGLAQAAPGGALRPAQAAGAGQDAQGRALHRRGRAGRPGRPAPAAAPDPGLARHAESCAARSYADNLPREINPQTGRVHTSYHQAVAATGRLSSQDPNLQNIPVRTAEGRRIRQAFIAEAHKALLSIDYSQIELRLMAHLSGDARLQEAFNKGLDIHQATAAEVAGLPLEQVSAEQRRAAKATNFGLIYGMSAFGLARQLRHRPRRSPGLHRPFLRPLSRREGLHGLHPRGAPARPAMWKRFYGRRLYLLQYIHSRNAAQRR